MSSLSIITKARNALAQAVTISDFAEIRDQGHAALKYLRSKRDVSLDARNDAAEIVIEAECGLGSLLRAMEKHKGGRGKRNPDHDGPGLGHTHRIRFQQMSLVPEAKRREHIAKVRSENAELTSAGVLKPLSAWAGAGRMRDMLYASASQLLAVALRKADTGNHFCYLCGGPCSERHKTSEYIRDSFTGLSEIASPGSQYVCAGCVLSMREQVPMPGRDKPQRMRTYSWVITETEAKAYSKAEREAMRRACLAPPMPPFAICLSESGQKHLLYRTPVNYTSDVISVRLETEIVTYTPDALSTQLDLVGRIIAATGKPALSEAPTVRMAMAVMERYHDGEQYYSEWERLHEEPLSRLAGFLSGGRDECQEQYPSDRAAVAAI